MRPTALFWIQVAAELATIVALVGPWISAALRRQPGAAETATAKQHVLARSAPWLLGVLIVLLGVSLIGQARTFASSPTTRETSTPTPFATQPVPTTTPTVSPAHLVKPYSAFAPGPCDGSTGLWAQDASGDYTIRCVANGLLVTNIVPASDNRLGGSVYFEGSSQSQTTFSPNYAVSLRVTFLSPRNPTYAGICVFTQPDGTCVSLSIANDGRWYIEDNGERWAAPGGMLPQAHSSYALSVEVHGTIIRYTIDGTQVTALSHPGYSSTHSIVLQEWAVDDESVVFSQFSYTPE